MSYTGNLCTSSGRWYFLSSPSQHENEAPLYKLDRELSFQSELKEHKVEEIFTKQTHKIKISEESQALSIQRAYPIASY